MGHTEFSVAELELLAGLAEGLTLSEIARRRWVTHSALSRALHSLERRTGLRLVERRGRRIQLTATGLVVARAASRAVELISGVEGVVRALRRGEAGLLRILASATPADYLLPDAIGAFVREIPAARVSLRVAGLLALHEEAGSGNYDVGVGPAEPVPVGWRAEELYVDELIFFVAPAHPYANQSVRWETLRSAVLVGAMSGSSWDRLWARVARRPFDADYVVELRNPEAVKRLVAAGCGVGVLPASAVQRELAASCLARVHVPGLSPELPYSLFVRSGVQSALVDRFCEILRACLPRGRGAVSECSERRARIGRAAGPRRQPAR